jgi:conjugal transfer/type IV secretion protein DotA/TraY
VGAANALWAKVIQFNNAGGNMHADTREVDLQNSMSSVSAIFTANVCMQKINQMIVTDPSMRALFEDYITVFRIGDQIMWGRYIKGLDEPPLCGAISLPSVGSSLISGTGGATDPEVEARKRIFANAIMQAKDELLPAADEALSNNGTTANLSNSFTTAARALQRAAQDVSSTFSSLSKINQQAVLNGWIHAGSYYFQLIQNTGSGFGIPVNLGTTGLNATQINTILGPTAGAQTLSSINNTSGNYIQNVMNNLNAPPPAKSDGLQLNAPNVSSPDAKSILAAIFGGLFESLIKDLNKQMTTGGVNQDPLASMAQFGSTLALTTEITFWAALGLVFLVWIGTSILSCLQPLGNAMNFLMSIVMPVAMIIISLLWVAGLTLGLYVPLIPYLVFTFGAVGWIILVIEAMLGASLIALTFIVPSEDEIGKAGHALVILLGLFLRPALMVLGFILAIQLLYVAISMLNFGFWATLIASTGGTAGVGMFGMVGILLIYASIATGMVHEAFSLIYLLPNKVLRWMGGGPEEEEAGRQVKELKGSVDKGAGIGKSAMTSSLSAADSKRLQSSKK